MAGESACPTALRRGGGAFHYIFRKVPVLIGSTLRTSGAFPQKLSNAFDAFIDRLGRIYGRETGAPRRWQKLTSQRIAASIVDRAGLFYVN